MTRQPKFWTALAIFTVCASAQTPPGTLTTLYVFTGLPDGANPSSGLISGPSGVIYGTTVNGGLLGSEPWQQSGCGTVFSLTPPTVSGDAWTENILYTFTGGSDGCGPSGVAIGRGGVLYGTTSNGVQGTAFSLTPPAIAGGAWTEETLHTFAGCPTDAGAPLFGLAVGAGGVLYGNGFYGGDFSCVPAAGGAGAGAVFALTPPASPGGAWIESMVFSIGALNDGPSAGLVVGSGGVLYGISDNGDGGGGAVFTLAPPTSPGGAWTETVLSYLSASNSRNDGSTPITPVVLAPGGILYGTTSGGGVDGGGEVFSLTPSASAGGSWTYTVLRDFSSTKGNPIGGSPEQLTLTRAGELYTACAEGGTARAGTVLRLTPPAAPGDFWTQTVVHTFVSGDGISPNGALMIRSDGLLYGTTYGRTPGYEGGEGRFGTIFSLQP